MDKQKEIELLWDKYKHTMLCHDDDGENYPCEMINKDNLNSAISSGDLFTKGQVEERESKNINKIIDALLLSEEYKEFFKEHKKYLTIKELKAKIEELNSLIDYLTDGDKITLPQLRQYIEDLETQLKELAK